MCGILGVVAGSGESGAWEARCREGLGGMHRRGPDGQGVWGDPQGGVTLGHVRLAILDLSSAGHQPMSSDGGRYVVTYNGEIYNFRELRVELEALGHRFTGHSDTEVMLIAFVAWGVSAAVARFNGMFAFALWDREERTLWLGRDRFGEKPLYYTLQGDSLLFASELKGLLPLLPRRPEIDRDALSLFLRHNHVPAPLAIYSGVRKLPPATLLRYSPGERSLADPVAYWSLDEVVADAQARPFAGGDEALVERLEQVLGDAVRRRMIADVPLGAFLSGGVDSTAIVALMQAHSPSPVRTFTIGFGEGGFDESAYAGAVARALGTEHTQLFVTPESALEVIPSLPELYDEPFSDSSQIPTYLVSRLTAEHVTVALSGDGGDELFAGYNRHRLAARAMPRLARLPSGVRHMGAWACRGAARLPAPLLARALRGDPVETLHKLARLLGAADGAALYRTLLSQWDGPTPVLGGEPAETPLAPIWRRASRLPAEAERFMFSDTLFYLPGDILTKVDRASMGASIEARVPFLDPEVVEFAWRVGLHTKLKDGKGKWPLRQMLTRFLPPALYERPKAGFAVPMGAWLRGPLREWAETLLAADRLRGEGFLDAVAVQHEWRTLLKGRAAGHHRIWGVLMFQAWLERQ